MPTAATGKGCDLTNCRPDDVLVYMVEDWLPHHAGRGAGGLPAPSTLKAVTFYAWAVRGATTPPLGNPCDSIWVEDFRAAYQRLSLLGGFEEFSAVPLAEGQYEQLVAYLWGAVTHSSSILTLLVLLRDMRRVQYMWQTTMRGHDTLHFRTSCTSPPPRAP
ncbi:hypothetical protein TSOC_011893 [Tetrabaena socialis]|uniref:Uncharacterized protein n=1 Tax=Tetrabaena socialis TaxID=47790 RepID=A0A2J7ZPF2_9CHLO|nr:hypothetical protein TSOC_011893 [Tetrabaena socialis]|eukprot:PNH02157.1 hypothetical protein TSOC_011893 [Tetrabaena socialis]